MSNDKTDICRYSRRATDAERDETLGRLAYGHSVGSLDLETLEARLDKASQAKTVDQLGDLVCDLPCAPRPAQRVSFSLVRVAAWIGLWLAVAVSLAGCIISVDSFGDTGAGAAAFMVSIAGIAASLITMVIRLDP